MEFSKRGLVLPLLLPNNLLTSYSDEEKEFGTTCSINSILAIPPASSLIHSTDSQPSITPVSYTHLTLPTNSRV